MDETIQYPLDEGFLSLDSNWRFTYVNKITLEFLNKKMEDLTGKIIWEEYPKTIGTSLESVCESVMAKRSAQRVITKNIISDMWIYILAFPLNNGVSIFWRNVTEEKQKQEELKSNEERMRLLLESFSQAFWETDPKGIPIKSFPLPEEFAKSAYEDSGGPDWLNLIHPEDKGLVFNAWQESILTSNNLNVVYRLKLPDGTWGWSNVRAIPIRNEDGEVVKWSGMNIDITERKLNEERLRDSENRFRALITATSELIYRLSADCRQMTILSNSGFIKNTANPNEDWLNDHIPPEEQYRLTDFINRSLKEFKTLEMEHKVYLSNNEIGWVSSRAVPIQNSCGEIVEWFGTANNITDRKKAEANLLESQENLRAMIRKLKLADENRNSFINTLSHELRNPLAAISMAMTLLRNSTSCMQTEKAMDIMERQIGQFSCLVDDLLDVTRITRNKIELKKQLVDINETVYNAAMDYQAQFTKKNIAFQFCPFEVPVYMEVDPARIIQAVGNLLHNAAKFTSTNDTVTIKVEVDEGSNEAVITVQDTGKGIDPEIVPFLFEPFVQVDTSLDHSFGGLGLGLTIVKGIIDLHEGTVSLSSEGIGKGTKFEIRLPLRNSGETVENTVSEKKIDEYFTLKILVIEDNEDLGEIMNDLLISLGHEVNIFSNGADGIKFAKRNHIDVLISDIGLPGLTGYDISEIFRRDEQLADIYRIALSGYAQPADKEFSKNAGFQQHLAKPVHMEDLKMALLEAYNYRNQIMLNSLN